MQAFQSYYRQMPNQPFKPKKIAITGANGHLGGALCADFANAGYEVVALTRDDLDLAQSDSVQDYCQRAKRGGLSFDFWINNAADQGVAEFKDLTPELIERQMATNFASVALIYQAIARVNLVRESILNISSIESELARPGHAIYGASKAALDSLTKSAARELAPVRSNALRLGLMHRPGIEDAWPQGVTAWQASTPLHRLGKSEDLFHAAEFLLNAQWLTGSILTLDGGNTIVTNW